MLHVNLLAVSIGNTRTKVGAFDRGKLVSTAAVENAQTEAIARALEEAYAPLRERSAPVVLASVNPPVSARVIELIGQRLGKEVVRVESDLPVPIGRQLDPESLVGEDRLLNAAAAYHVLRQACVVIDAGTAITVDFIDGAGTFHGGAIAPGAQMMLDSLHGRTAQLPELEMQRPSEPIGHNTTQAMLCGAFYGLRGMVSQLIERYAETAGAYPMVVATGGDAELLFRDFELVERVVPDLVLMGIAVTMQSHSTESAATEGRNGGEDDGDRDGPEADGPNEDDRPAAPGA